jgi:hypothetical protein
MNKRICNRLDLHRTLLLELDNGEILQGRTVNLSPRGALLRTDARPVGELLGRAGTLFIISDEGHFSVGYPCKVARQEGDAIALEVDRKAAAAFGNYLTRELLGR